jgi:D-beta-D-heptose 7-phosphate kinase/D-beta-D-heptose 1-phosphate adenosyltransferase
MGKKYRTRRFSMDDIIKELKSGVYIVIGDLMVDEYNYGTVTRISPEAPVPVLNHKNKTLFPGGAANVAMNLACLGNHVELVGMLGKDEAGYWLKKQLDENGIGTGGIVFVPSVSTIRKVRFATADQHILRVDYENLVYENSIYTKKVVKYIEKFLDNCEVAGVLVSDYNKGLIPSRNKDNPFLKLFEKICKKNYLCGADTKKHDSSISIFAGLSFLKPNKSELSKVINKEIISLDMLKSATEEYLKLCKVKSVVVTLGEEGMYYNNCFEDKYSKAIETKVVDVTGAGDTVFAVLMNSLGSGLSMENSMKLANLAASIVVGSNGTKAITKSELLRRLNLIENS